jgi:hypothetical protein
MAKNVHVRIKKNNLRKLAQMAPGEADAAIRVLAEEGVNIAKQLMLNSPRTGRSYVRGGKVHVASSPGNPPRPDRGRLINSLRHESRGTAVRVIIAGTEYARPLEFGSPARNRAARPFMGPMAYEVEGLVDTVFDHFLEDKA